MRSLTIFFILLPITIFAQGPKENFQKAAITIEAVNGSVPHTHMHFNADPEMFQFAIVTDRTGSHRPGVFMEGVNMLNLMQPAFVMSVGDLIEGYTSDTVELIRQWNEFDHFVAKLTMPFFYVPGNHDITNQVMEDLWHRRFGKTFYHFLYKDVLFLALNSEDQKRGAGKGCISDEQFDYIERTLDEYQDVRWTLIFLHQPLWHQKETNRWNQVEELLKERKHTVFAGHEHRYVKETRNDGKYFTLATTGGGSKLRGRNFGEFDHVVWVTMKDNGPVIANLLLDGIWDEDLVTKSQSEWIRMVSNEQPFMIEPVVMEDSLFFIGGANIKITNDRNVPMKVRFEEHNSNDLTGTVEFKSLEVAPNSVSSLKYALRSRKYEYAHPFGLKAFVQYESDDSLASIEIPYEFKIKPIKKRKLEQLETLIEIDGNEEDWGPLAYNLPEGEDFKGFFDLKYDDKYLYFAMLVEDSNVYSVGEGTAWTQDNIGFGFSAEPYVKSAMNTGKNYYSNVFFVMITPENEGTASVITRELPEGSKYKCITKPYGYFGEIAIPLSYIQSIQGAEWRTIRVGVAADDIDPGIVNRYWWLPNWRDTSQNFIGSGMFWK